MTGPPLIEFPADDPDRAVRFWRGLLGVELAPRAAGAGEGWEAEEGGLRLGVHRRGTGPGDTGSLPYLTVEDMADRPRARPRARRVDRPSGGALGDLPGLRGEPVRPRRRCRVDAGRVGRWAFAANRARLSPRAHTGRGAGRGRAFRRRGTSPPPGKRGDSRLRSPPAWSSETGPPRSRRGRHPCPPRGPGRAARPAAGATHPDQEPRHARRRSADSASQGEGESSSSMRSSSAGGWGRRRWSPSPGPTAETTTATLAAAVLAKVGLESKLAGNADIAPPLSDGDRRPRRRTRSDRLRDLELPARMLSLTDARGRGLHQSQPRPSAAARDDAPLRRGQAEPVHQRRRRRSPRRRRHDRRVRAPARRRSRAGRRAGAPGRPRA